MGRFLRIALGSASELDYHLQLAHDLGLPASSDYRPLRHATVEIKKMLSSFIRGLRIDN